MNLRNEEIPQSPQLLFSEAVKTKVVVEPKAEMFPQFKGFPEEQKVSTWTLSMPKVRPNKVYLLINLDKTSVIKMANLKDKN